MGYQLHINNSLCQKVDYEYDNDQRINRVVLDNDGAYQYFWNTNTGLPEKMIWPDGVSRELSYENQRNLVNNIVYKTSYGTSLLNLEKSFDSLSRLTSERNSLSAKGQRAFVYNSRGEVISDTQELGDTSTYAYDNIGNFLTNSQNQTESRNYLSNLLNQYTSLTENTPSQTEIFIPEYDESGNQTQVRTATGDWQVNYNAENRPISFTKGTKRIDCLYDYMGRRTRKNHYQNDILVSSALYVYKGYQLIAELDGMEKKVDQQLAKTWLWDPTGQFNNSPLEMLVWDEDITEYPVTEYPVTEYPVTEYPVTEYPVTEYPVTEYPPTEYPIIPFFSTADLLMRDKKNMEVITTVNSDHILLSLDIPLTSDQRIYVDRLELVLHNPQTENESYNYKALVTLQESLTVYCEREGEIIRLDLTSWESAKRVVPPSGNIRIDFLRQAKNILGAIWENVENITWHGNAASAPLVHVSGIIIKHNNPPTTDYPTTDYPGLGEQSHAQVKSEIPQLMNNTIPRSSIPRNNPASLLSGSPGRTPKRYYYMNDGKRNITSLRSQQEGICATYTYGTFGQKLEETGEIAKTNPFRYSSEYHDDDLSLIYYNYRHYNPKDGRWLSPDPKQEEGGVNLYAFCANNPTSRIDNLGLDSAMAGASKTGFSAHWGNIVREKQRWAKVCYKYYKKADYMGFGTQFLVWNELADATKLNYEERDKWVYGYTPTPSPGMLFKVPNTFCIYKAKFEGLLESIPGSTMNHLRTKMDEIKERFLKSGVNIVEKKDLWDKDIFVSLWKEKGILGIGFTGHGDPLAFGACGEEGWGTSPLDIERRGISYKLAIIVAYNCVSLKVGWQQFLSRSGKIYGFDYYYSKMADDGKRMIIASPTLEGSIILTGMFN